MWTRVLLILLVGWTQLAWAGSSTDENHTLRVDSKPYFPIGVFDVYPQEELAKAAALGFNTVEVPFKVMDRRFPDESQGFSAREYLDEAQRLGLKVIPWFGGYDPDSQGKGFLERAVPFIHEYKSHPAVLAWYSIDEPSGMNVGPKELAEIYRAFREADPDRVTVSVFCKLPGDGVYVDTVDVFGIDPYPFGQDARHGKTAHDLVTEMLTAIDITKGAKPIWSCPQGFGAISSWKGVPTADEYRISNYIPVIYGAKGLLAYTWRMPKDLPDGAAICNDTALEEGAARTNKELRRLAPVILEAKRRVTSHEAVHVGVFDQGDATYLMVANASPGKARATLGIDLQAAASVEDLFSTESFERDASGVTLTLAPNGVRVLKVSWPEGKSARRAPDVSVRSEVESP